MKKVILILAALALTALASSDMRPFLTAQVKADEKASSVSDCNCEFNEAAKKGDSKKAKESAEKIITESPASPEAKDAYLWLGLYEKYHHEFDKSTKLYEKAHKLFPNTWTSAEASARIGCNYYKMNNYIKSLDYFRRAGLEAKTWQQRKYANAWAKHIHFMLAGDEKLAMANCATKSIYYYLNSKGIKLDTKKFASSLNLKDGLVPLSDIMSFLKKENIKLKAVKCPLDKIKDLKLPIVAVVKPSHMIVIKEFQADKNKIKVHDPYLGDVYYYKKELAEIWEGKVLTSSAPWGWFFASLNKKELDGICLGTCPCCPAWPSAGPCGGDDSESCCTGGSGGPGPGGPGYTGGGGCSGCVAVSSGFGFPQVTVDMSSMSLIIRDTPIGYDSSVGQDVKISLIYVSDQPSTGIFGNCWHSNLETKIEEIFYYDIYLGVNVTRTTGFVEWFFYSGDQYNPPPGVSDVLVKNEDETFTLNLIKSHRKYHYDTHANGGKLLAIEDRNGNTITFQYTGSTLTSITDAVGRVTSIQYISGKVTTITDPLSRQALFAYDANGDLTQVLDMAGNEFTYTYDIDKNITLIDTPNGNYSIVHRENLSDKVVGSITDPGNNLWQYPYIRQVKDPRGNTTAYGAMESGDIYAVTDPLSNAVSYGYDWDRNRTEITDKRNNVTYYTYDDNHNVTSKTDPQYHTWTYTYDTGTNNLMSAVDPRGKITAYEYDTQNNLVSVTEKAPDLTVLSTITYTYYGTGLVHTINNNGNTTTNTYNTNGDLVQVTDPEGNITTFGYDAIGRKTSMTNSNGTTTYEYDNLNRITKITHPDSTYIQYTYNCCNLSQKRDENGKLTDYEYNALGKLTKVTDALNNETNYTYDSVGNLISLKDAKNNTTTYTYDVLNRLTRITYPAGDTESYTYDPEGNMLTKTDGSGRTIYYTYDENNRLTQIKNTPY
jgi:YD repeat-containing protein